MLVFITKRMMRISTHAYDWNGREGGRCAFVSRSATFSSLQSLALTDEVKTEEIHWENELKAMAWIRKYISSKLQ